MKFIHILQLKPYVVCLFQHLHFIHSFIHLSLAPVTGVLERILQLNLLKLHLSLKARITITLQ